MFKRLVAIGVVGVLVGIAVKKFAEGNRGSLDNECAYTCASCRPDCAFQSHHMPATEMVDIR